MINWLTGGMVARGVEGVAEEDEPVLVLKASNPLAPGIAIYWARMLEQFQPEEGEHDAGALEEYADQMRQWRVEHRLPPR